MLYLVGGTVRDHFMNRPINDLDFAVEADSYEEMVEFLIGRGLKIWQERPEFVTIRGNMPVANLGGFGGIIQAFKNHGNMFINADFTLCRAEAMYHDKRHPSVVTPASLFTDLERRDFTMNAIAMSESGVVFDRYNGRSDISARILRCVGYPMTRFEEDPLRILRALRFACTHTLYIAGSTHEAIKSPQAVLLLDTLPSERIYEEVKKMFQHGTPEAMNVLDLYPEIGQFLLRKDGPLSLMPVINPERGSSS